MHALGQPNAPLAVMKTALILLLSCASLIRAQDQKPQQVKRLESMTWDLSSHKLVWVVSTGNMVDGKFVSTSEAKYEVSPDEASMAFQQEKRPVDNEEAKNLHDLLNVLSLYCVESVVWWDQGAQPDSGGKPVKMEEQRVQKPPSVPAGQIVAVKQPGK
jgi:hypothetical protein